MQLTPGTISADYKAPGGKLLRVSLTLARQADPPVITSLRLTGDFFMHPEDAILDLEERLIGAPWETVSVRERVQAFFETGVQVIGATVDDIVHVVLAAS